MTESEAKSLIEDIIGEIAPEADFATLPATRICARRSISIRWIS